MADLFGDWVPDISIHAPRTGSDKARDDIMHYLQAFQSTLPARGATGMPAASPFAVTISIHAPRTGSDGQPRKPRHRACRFQSTLPARGATHGMQWHVWTTTFQSTLPARGATLGAEANAGRNGISIHAPRTGSDYSRDNYHCLGLDFNPRSPHGERPQVARLADEVVRNFNPRSPHGERPPGDLFQSWTGCISIHAPRTGSDDILLHVAISDLSISIHAPRTGSDAQAIAPVIAQGHFNPRSPHGERQ